MLPALTSLSLALATTPLPVSVGDITLANLVCYSDRIVIGQVEDVVPIDRGVRLKGDRQSSPTSIALADVRVLRTLKGEGGSRVLYPAGGTWTCDITGALTGETVLLFLTTERVLEQEGPRFRANVRRHLGKHPLLRVLWAGRGRMPLWSHDGSEHAVFWPEVVMPEDLEAGPGPDPTADFIRALPIAVLAHRIEELVIGQRATHVRAWAGRSGARGERGFGWTFEVHGDRSAYLAVDGKTGSRARERKFTIPVEAFMSYQRSMRKVRRTPWTGSVGHTPGRVEGTRSLYLTAPGQVATIRIFDVGERDMESPDAALETRKALRLWGAVRGLFDEPGCVDRRAEDARWLEGDW